MGSRMSLFIVPWVVLAVAVLVALYLPIGRDLAVPVFLVPWATLSVDLGVSVTLAQLILILLMIKYGINRRLSIGAVPHFGVISVIVYVGLVSALLTFASQFNEIEYAGGVMRNGFLRTVVVLISFLLSFVPFALVNAKGTFFTIMGLLKVYVVSVLILGALGVLQYMVYNATGTDLFPIWMFDSGRDRYVTAIVAGYDIMRPSSLAGEPKGLAMITAVAAILIIAVGRSLFRKRWIFYFSFLLFLLVIFLTQSTSAFLSFGIGIVVFFGLRFVGRSLRRSTILICYFLGTAAIFGIYFSNVANVYLVKDRSLMPRAENTLELLYLRSLGRMEVEDMDWVIIRSFQEDPIKLVVGRGFGLGHLFVEPYIPVQNFYMFGTLVSPKSGVILILVNGGVVALALFIIFLAKITPVARNANRVQAPMFREYILRIQMAFISIVVMMLLRTYIIDVGLMLFAIMSAAQQPQGLMPQKSRSNVRRRMQRGEYPAKQVTEPPSSFNGKAADG
jgi:hypothetical protein